MNILRNNNQIIFLFVILFIIISPSCASQEEKLELAKQEVELIKNKIDTKNMVTGLAFKDEKRFSYRGHFIDDKLVFIFSDTFIGVTGSATYMFYYKDGKLIYFNENSIKVPSNSSGKKQSILTDIYFDGDQVLESTRVVQGLFTDVSDEEIKEIIEISNLLYNKIIEKKQALKL
ncbi:MAG: hypothetical protein NZM09_00075 [Ignavibacterium sp.]|nr:hypothetical protein [Ignavibacterium sp.]MCX7611012.1 hypothetical protein [Ignavibacterium sp.]MDW8374065.1 hypothetical protein [Ignavibacteriales bacterium]